MEDDRERWVGPRRIGMGGGMGDMEGKGGKLEY